MTGLIDRLEQRGWVRRTADPADRRKVIVELAQRYETGFATELFEPLAREMEEVNASYDDEQLTAIVDWLEKANAAVQRSTDRMRDRPSRSAGR